MLEFSEQNVAEYLRARGSATAGQILVQPLSGGVANVVLKIFDAGAGEKIGTDMRSPAKIKRGDPDTRMNRGACFVLKQPLEKFRTAAEWIVDQDRILVERDCINLLHGILPAGSVPDVLWFDEANHVLAISCAPTDSVIWKKQLLQGKVSNAVAQQAGMLLAMMHSATRGDAAVQQRYGDPKFFMQQRTEPYLAAVAAKHPDIAAILNDLSRQLLEAKHCLIHGDYSPKNIFVVPAETSQPASPAEPTEPSGGVYPGAPVAAGRSTPTFSHLLLLDFEVAFYGHPAFDVATLINHLLLKGFVAKSRWRPYVIAADAFLQTYEQAVDKPLAAATDTLGGQSLAALLLARIDGKSPAEYLTDPELQNHIRTTAKALLPRHLTLLETLDEVSVSLADWADKK